MGLKMAWEEGTKQELRGKTEGGELSDPPCGNGSLHARPKAYFTDEYAC